MASVYKNPKMVAIYTGQQLLHIPKTQNVDSFMIQYMKFGHLINFVFRYIICLYREEQTS